MSLTVFHFKGLYERSGVSSYLRRIMEAQQKAGCSVTYADVTEGWSEVQVESIRSISVEDEQDLYEKARRHGADVVHVHHSLQTQPKNRIPTVRTIHNHQPYCPSRYRHLGRSDSPCPRSYSLSGCLWGLMIDQCGPQRPDRWVHAFRTTWNEQAMFDQMRYVAVSDFVQREMIKAGCPPDRVSTLHLPAPDPLEPTPPPRGRSRFLYMGRLEQQKGVDILIQAMRRHAASHFDIAGDGPLEDNLERKVAEHGLGERVHFHGWVPFGTITKLMRQARAVLLPSTCHETGGLTILEAYSHARAVIASRVGVTPELVRDKQTGLLVQPSDPGALSDAMDRLASNRELAETMGEKGRQTVEAHYLLQDHLDRLHAVYHEVLD